MLGVPEFTSRKTAAQVCRAISSDFKLKGITHAKAAEMLGVEPRTVSNQISGKRPFGKISASRYAKAFGYDESFLLFGQGRLKKQGAVSVMLQAPNSAGTETVEVPLSTLNSLLNRLSALEEQVAGLSIPTPAKAGKPGRKRHK